MLIWRSHKRGSQSLGDRCCSRCNLSSEPSMKIHLSCRTCRIRLTRLCIIRIITHLFSRALLPSLYLRLLATTRLCCLATLSISFRFSLYPYSEFPKTVSVKRRGGNIARSCRRPPVISRDQAPVSAQELHRP